MPCALTSWGAFARIISSGSVMKSYRLTTVAAAAALAAALGSAAWAQTPPPASPSTPQSSAPAAAAPATQGPATPAAPGAAPAPAAAPYTPIAPAGDIVDTLKASGEFKTLIKALDATNLTGVLKTHSNLTLFAPTDAAFAAYEPQAQLFGNLTALQALLTHHLINAPLDSSKFKNAHGPVKSVAGDDVVLDGTGPVLKADNADIIQADVHASNGIIHVVDQVLKAGSVPATLPGQEQGQDQSQGAAPPAETKPQG